MNILEKIDGYVDRKSLNEVIFDDKVIKTLGSALEDTISDGFMEKVWDVIDDINYSNPSNKIDVKIQKITTDISKQSRKVFEQKLKGL